MRAVLVATALIAVIVTVVLVGGSGAPQTSDLPPIRHVFTIVLENKDYDETFGENPPAPYLAETLPAKGQLLTGYHGTGHSSLGNYLTMISGQSENPQTQEGCVKGFTEMRPGTIADDGQALGSGCVYPPEVETVAGQLEDAGLTWRGYMEDMGNDPQRDGGTTCAHPPVGGQDHAQDATPTDQYATRHNPFVFFHSIIDDEPGCDADVVNLEELRADLRDPQATPDFAYIVPDLCSDGHEDVCADPAQKGGYEGIDEFLREWVPLIMESDAYESDGLLIVTFDESESGAEACCFIPSGPNVDRQGLYGPGGGLTGTVLISPFIDPGSVDPEPYNHYDYLHTIEDVFGLDYLGYAARDEVDSFGDDVFGR
jgi:phosphatidylinositol-3-phosphatase